MGDVHRCARPPRRCVPGHDEPAGVDAFVGEPVEEHGGVGEDRQLVARDHVEAEQLGVEEAGRAGRRHDGPGADRLDVADGPGELRGDLRVAELALVLDAACRRPSGTRSRPRTAATAGRSRPFAVSASRSWSRQSFWLRRRLGPSSTISAESPPGPSVIDVSTWISIVRPSATSIGFAGSVRDEPVEAEAAQVPLELGRGEAGQEHRSSTGRRGRSGTRRRGGRRGGARCTGSRAARPSP